MTSLPIDGQWHVEGKSEKYIDDLAFDGDIRIILGQDFSSFALVIKVTLMVLADRFWNCQYPYEAQ